MHTPQRFFQNQPSFPSQTIPIRPNYSKIPQRFPTNSQVFGNQSNQTNVFKPNPNKQFPPPTPMSTSTRQTNNTFRTNTGQQTHLKNYFQSRPNQQPNFIAEELYNINTVNSDFTDPHYEDSAEQTYFVDENNFNEGPLEPQYYDELNPNPNFLQGDLRNACAPEIISFNNTNTSELFYITFPEINVKFLIDCCSTKSFIDPDIAKKLYPNNINYDPFIVSSVFQQSAHQYSVYIPASHIFKLKKNKHLKVYLFKFYNVFNGLIGSDILKELEASIDFKEEFLITPYTKIKLKFLRTKSEVNNITISPRVEQVVKIKTNIQNVEIPYQKLHNCEIPNCISVAKMVMH